MSDKETIRRAQEAYFIIAAQRKIEQAQEKIIRDQKWTEMRNDKNRVYSSKTDVEEEE